MGRHNFRCVSVVVTEMNECAIEQCDKTSILLLVVLCLTGGEEPGSLSNVDESARRTLSRWAFPGPAFAIIRY